MTKHDALGATIAAVVMVLAFAWKRRKGSAMATAAPSDPQAAFDAPYYNNGMTPITPILNGNSTPFNSVVNVSVNPSAAAALGSEYIPLFGFVGMVAQ